jgi:hypothetical protein
MADFYGQVVSILPSYSGGTALTFKRWSFDMAVARAGRNLLKCPLLLCQFLLERFH